jgi:MoxR-like ATPase
MEESIEKYIVGLIMATRDPSEPASEWIEYGSSPRGTISLDQCARSIAWLSDRDFVTPEDVQNIIHDVMRHRLILTFEAESQGITANQVIDEIVRTVPVP